MKITTKWLDKWGACDAGREYFVRVNISDPAKLAQHLIRDNKLEWCNWLIVRVLDRRGRIRYACFAARQALAIFEAQCPGDRRPRLAIEAAERCSIADRSARAARAARYAAQAAGWAGCAAGDAAWAADRDAGEVAEASRASRAAWDAAWAARAAGAAGEAGDAARAAWAAGDAARITILEHGISLMHK
jgi:hypothetical protein